MTADERVEALWAANHLNLPAKAVVATQIAEAEAAARDEVLGHLSKKERARVEKALAKADEAGEEAAK